MDDDDKDDIWLEVGHASSDVTPQRPRLYGLKSVSKAALRALTPKPKKNPIGFR